MTPDTDHEGSGGSPSIQREDCNRCGGSGEIIDEVAGRSGVVPCPSCDNIPESELPDELPEDPHALLEEIEDKLSQLTIKEDAYEGNRRKLQKAAQLIEEVSESDHFLDPDDVAVLQHLSVEVGSICGHRELFDKREIRFERDTLRQRKREVETYIEALEEQQETETEADQ